MYPDVGQIFLHGYEIKHTYPERPESLEAGEAGGYDYERDICKEKVKMVMHREEGYLYNKKLSYCVLWKYCLLALQEFHSRNDRLYADERDHKMLCNCGRT